MKPLIGITCAHDNQTNRVYLTQYYSRAVASAGGIPLLLPPTPVQEIVEYYCQLLDGLLLSGGVDVDPRYFGEEPLPQSGEITPERDAFEIPLVKKWLVASRPLLAICRGIQVLNIAAGGDIYQNIHSQKKDVIKHMQQAPKWYGSHQILLESDTLLASIFADEKLSVNSFHHQAVRRLGEGFVCSARAGDGIIEAIELPTKTFVLGVQWHPECMWEEDRIHHRLFQGLVEACTGKSRNFAWNREY